jgi:hypothetical protein
VEERCLYPEERLLPVEGPRLYGKGALLSPEEALLSGKAPLLYR